MDVDSLQHQALDVRQPDENFDPTIEPQNGEEYLMKVIYERKQCPSVVVKPLKKSKIQFVNLPESSISDAISDTSPISLRPSSEWKQAQLSFFNNLREKVSKLRNDLSANGYNTDEKNLPLVDDTELWQHFCRENQPLLSTMLRINQRSLETLLEYQSEWLKDEIYNETSNLCQDNEWLGKWIYATLACLRLPLEADVVSSVRNIGKTCIILRNKLQENENLEAAPYNLFLIIISKLFGQLDLLEFV